MNHRRFLVILKKIRSRRFEGIWPFEWRGIGAPVGLLWSIDEWPYLQLKSLLKDLSKNG
jgi:hypothetical protein